MTGIGFIRDSEAARRFAPEVVVVGAGPVGLTAGAALAARGRRVLVVERGPRSGPRPPPAADIAEFTDPGRHAPLSLALAVGFGGTSSLWGGRCLPFDPIDMEGRNYLDGLAWPLRESDVAPFYEETADVLGCAPARFVAAQDALAAKTLGVDRTGLRVDQLERWCNEPFTPRHLRRRAFRGQLVALCDATVTDLDFNEAGNVVTGVRVNGGVGPDVIRTAAVILACGGLETSRLLLNIQERRPRLFGGSGGALGRHYMGHVSGTIARIRFAVPSQARIFAYGYDRDSAWRRRFTLKAETQRSERLPNIAFYPSNPKIGDAAHGSGVLSALYLLLAAPFLGRRLISEAIRRMQLEGASPASAHVRNVLSDMPGVARDLAEIFGQRFVHGRRKPNIFLYSRSGVYPLHYHAEHRPSAASRVTLNATRDRFGLKGLCIDLRFADEDAEGVVRAHRVLNEELGRSGLGSLEFEAGRGEPEAAVLRQARDGFHQIGLTRMAENASGGVVDQDCKAFGIENLFLGGTSVLPTSGQANPTFFASALAVRLAAHVAGLIQVGAK